LYFCDGTENERSVERRFKETATRVHEYLIPHPCKARPNIVFTVHFYGPGSGRPIATGQDSKHYLKTARNNWFSGAKTMTAGNEIITFRQLRNIVKVDSCPLFARDVEKVDKQDDAAATRLFSAATLEFFANQPERHIDHSERIRILLRTKFFVEIWTASLQELGYPLAKHCMSREALDILDFLISGYFELFMDAFIRTVRAPIRRSAQIYS